MFNWIRGGTTKVWTMMFRNGPLVQIYFLMVFKFYIVDQERFLWNVYKQNHSFPLNEDNKKASPIGNDSFWIDLLNDAPDLGFITYEHD